jgi:hypothetical protein
LFRRARFLSLWSSLSEVYYGAFLGVSSGNSPHAHQLQQFARMYARLRSLSRLLNVVAVLMVLIEISGQNVIE